MSKKLVMFLTSALTGISCLTYAEDNSAYVAQNGNDNFSYNLSSGYANTVSVLQFDGVSNSARSYQYGDRNLATITQSGDSNYSYLTQSGDDDIYNSVQIGTGNKSNVSQ